MMLVDDIYIIIGSANINQSESFLTIPKLSTIFADFFEIFKTTFTVFN